MEVHEKRHASTRRAAVALLLVPTLTLAIAVGSAAGSGAGKVKYYQNATIDGPEGIVAGPDGALWFANVGFGTNSVGRIATTGKVTTHTAATVNSPRWITAGPDGALWFANHGNDSIGRITTTGTVTHYTDPTINGPYGITTGSDGAVWFANFGNKSIGRITTTVTPGVKGFTPTSGGVGTTVTITGQNLAGATQVAFNGTTAGIVSDTATQIVTVVPAGAATGRITVKTAYGTATSPKSFTVT